MALNWRLPHTGRPANIGGLDLEALGLSTLDEVTDRYCAGSGVPRPPHLDWYFAFNLFRGVCIAQGIRKRRLDGNAAGDDAGAARAAADLPRFIEDALSYAGQAGSRRQAS